MLRCASEIFEAAGWEALTHSAVALRSGFARTTIYRYWPERVDLLRDAVLQRIDRDEVVVTGELRADLIANLSIIGSRIGTPSVRRAMVTVIELSEHDAEFERVRKAFFDTATATLTRLVKEGQTTGQIATDLDAATAVDLLYGPLASRVFFARRPIDDSFVQQVVDGFLLTHQFRPESKSKTKTKSNTVRSPIS